MTAPVDCSGPLLALRDAQQQIALAVLALHRRDWYVTEVHLRSAQQRATAAEIDLARGGGGRE